jgi:hypothetical protein
MKTSEATPALLSDDRLAEIRADDADQRPVARTSAWHDRRALLRHIDALAVPTPNDGGEALGRMARATFFGKPEAELLPWEDLDEEVRGAYIDTGLVVEAEGYKRGMAEGEAERARLQALVGKAYTEVAGEIVASDQDVATIASLTAKLNEAEQSRARWRSLADHNGEDAVAFAAAAQRSKV